MTLNIATAPDEIKTYNHNKYFLLDNNSAVLVNGLSTTIVLFPVKLLLSSESVSISSAQITPEIGFKNVVLGPDYKPQPPSEDEFIDLLNYITKDPTGIAEKPHMPYGKPAIGEKDCIEFFSKFIANREMNKMFNVK